MFNAENPIPEEQMIIQLAMIARTFAAYFIKRTDNKKWSLEDFIPDFTKKETLKNTANDLKNQIIGVVGSVGDEKAKKWVKKRTEQVNTMVKGTDGKMYKYKLEEFVRKRKKLPKRLRLRGIK